MTSEEHNKYLSYAFFAYSGFQGLMMLLMSGFFIALIGSAPGGPDSGVFVVFFLFMLVFQLIFTLPPAIAGWALYSKKPWGRLAGIIGGVMAGMSFPLGTAVCVYALWFLLGDNWKEVYPNGTVAQRRNELPGSADFARWEAEAEAFNRGREKEPTRGDWR